MFDRTKLLNIGGGVLPRTWQYSSDDDITAQGYFPKESRIQSGDKLTHVVYDRDNGSYEMKSYYVDVDDEGVLTTTEIPGGGSANLKELSVDPHIYEQIITPAPGWDGYNKVTVHKVTSAIDSNITAANIVNGVNILGVIGTASASAPKTVAKYVIRDNGVVEVSDADITGKFDDVIHVQGENLSNVANRSALAYAFYNTDVFGDASFPNCTSVGINSMSYTFYKTQITSLNMPALTEAPINSFRNVAGNCKNLISISFSNLGNASSNSFSEAYENAGSSNGFNADYGSLTYAGENSFRRAFYGSNITSINLTSLQNVGSAAFSSAFENTKQLLNFSAPNINMMSSYTGSSHFGGAFKNSNIEYVNMSSRKNVAAYAFSNVCQNCMNLISFDAGEIYIPSGNSSIFAGAFNNCVNLVNFNVLFYPNTSGLQATTATIFNNTCRNCSSLETLNLSSWGGSVIDFESSSFGVIGNMCCDCSNLTSVNLFSRYRAFDGSSGNAFKNCYNLKTLELTSLWNAAISNGFRNVFASSYITNLSFPSICDAINTCFVDMLKNVSDCTVHFPSSMESTMNSYPEVLSGFGGTNTTVLFDLPQVNWTNAPISLTNNGEMGGDDFAVSASSNSTNAYTVFNTSNSYWRPATAATIENPQNIIFYNPNPTRLFYVQLLRTSAGYGGNWDHSAYNIFGSNDNTSWEIINTIKSDVPAASSVSTSLGVQVMCNNFYKYYKVEFTANRPSVQRIYYTGIQHNS